jgi:outer membrane protein TolC
LTTAAKRVEAAEIYYDMARQRFLNGLGTSLEVQDALRSLNDARQSQVVAVYDRELAFAALENSVGFDFPLRRLAVLPESLQEPGE